MTKKYDKVNLMHDFIPERLRENERLQPYMDDLAEIFAPLDATLDEEQQEEIILNKMDKMRKQMLQMKEDFNDADNQKQLADEANDILKKGS